MLLKLVTVSGAAIGVFAVYEHRTHYNVFDHLHAVLPFLSFEGTLPYLMLGSNLRVFGPSQQPIALGAALILILPLAVYFARTVWAALVARRVADPPRSLGEWLTHGRRDARCRGRSSSCCSSRTRRRSSGLLSFPRLPSSISHCPARSED